VKKESQNDEELDDMAEDHVGGGGENSQAQNGDQMNGEQADIVGESGKNTGSAEGATAT
jgi:hypothetical protein